MTTTTAIDQVKFNNHIHAESIYQAHKAAFLDGDIPYDAPVRKFADREAVATALHAGELFPEIWKQVAIHSLSPYQRIGLYSLLAFSSPAAENKFKASFVACVENLLNVPA